ncbi:phosphate ABC transporter permease PstA [Vibrio rumoiensis]|uniref:Phosphate transport system permease protein PstA n=1 Tax=Vibrio rumoiensis 1S-45 TaxID=1188252 RepID=A0A1E5E5F1_9VIBR|nr:phosphate ABC transporter permease PstA [Vibrio rumoiensis]OEF28637.1 phosphate ABC transporter, permease protein PstA [Vibrio rumoiensis 1S-45]
MIKNGFDWIKSGNPWVWLTAGAVSISLISVLGLLLLIGWKGLVYFWPTPVYQWQDDKGALLLGQIYQRDYVSLDQLSDHDRQWPDAVIDKGEAERLSIKVANRDLYPQDFLSVLAIDLHQQQVPKNVAVFERTHSGDFFGRPIILLDGESHIEKDLPKHIKLLINNANDTREQIDDLLQGDMHQVTLELNKLNLRVNTQSKHNALTVKEQGDLVQRKKTLQTQFTQLEKKIASLQNSLSQQFIVVEDMRGERVSLPVNTVLDAWYPNNMSLSDKVGHWLNQVKKFLLDNPRESNSEGGVFPAIFGTVLLVILMSIMVMPLGVIAAIYLHEYARNTALTKLIRISVVNLAGVPSIVYGVFGLGFFVYTIGSSIDELFYSSSLPTPTFGTPGLLWSALTLAILTLPVVIVATEEGLARVPSAVRHGSYALGATKFETLWRIILPMVSPAIMTGLILAVARAAGEVAPLMLVGVVKLAPSLPVDGQFPFLHLDRKFMHLGFHIYDVGFQTPNIEAARPLVFATSFLLISVVVGLNITAIMIRNNLREKFRTLGSD